MTELQLSYYMITDERGRRRRSPCRLSEAEALDRYTDPVIIQGTSEVVKVGDGTGLSMAHLQRGNEKKPPDPSQG
jgi:hypothetical protein